MQEKSSIYPSSSENNGFKDYRIMWIQVSFDLPTKTRIQRQNVQIFRKRLIQHGFCMVQLSRYERYVIGHAKLAVYQRRILSYLPAEGSVEILVIPDSIYANILRFYNHNRIPQPGTPKQLAIF